MKKVIVIPIVVLIIYIFIVWFIAWNDSPANWRQESRGGCAVIGVIFMLIGAMIGDFADNKNK